MRNLDWLYRNNSMFRETVNQGAAQWMGSDSPVFAGEWLLREHEIEQSDYEDLRGQHLDGPCVVPDRFCSDVAKLQISQSVAQETGETAESDAAKSEIRDFADNREELVDRITDMVNAKWDELYGDSREKLEADVCAALYGASMDNDGYIPLEMAIGWLDRQAVITRREVLTQPDERDEQISELEIQLAALKEHCADQAEQLRRLTDENAELRKLAEKYRAGSVAAQDEAEAWRAKCGELLDAAHEMVRIGGDVA